MIFGNIKHEKTYSKIEDDLKVCFEYAKKNALSEFDKGSYQLDGDNIFVNIVEYETCGKEQRFWEAHKKYIDIHLMLEGSEIIDVGFIENLVQKDYQEKEDFLPLEGDPTGSIKLEEGDFLVCYPEDAHMTAIKVNKKSSIKKAIFKVRLK